uniref:Secreted protein n=1 Tax=Meloidogyne hapla TaxID=6305 RepID=A0A1I8BW52_MELHA
MVISHANNPLVLVIIFAVSDEDIRGVVGLFLVSSPGRQGFECHFPTNVKDDCCSSEQDPSTIQRRFLLNITFKINFIFNKMVLINTGWSSSCSDGQGSATAYGCASLGVHNQQITQSTDF